VLASAWRFWTGSWRSARRARWVYVAMTGGFIALAAFGAVRSEPAVAAIAGAMAAITAVLALVAPRVVRWAGRSAGLRYNDD
jgi:hypothetical protein